MQHKAERQKQRTARKWLRVEATGQTSFLHIDKLQIAEQTGIQVSHSIELTMKWPSHLNKK